jgi:hypothetical protein
MFRKPHTCSCERAGLAVRKRMASPAREVMKAAYLFL